MIERITLRKLQLSFPPEPVRLLCIFALACAGCVSGNYQYTHRGNINPAKELEALTVQQVSHGERRPILDSIGNILSIPDKIVLWDRRVSNHDISLETQAKIEEYLAANDLTSVKVRVNQYAPGEEWQRLVANKSVHWGWRYTFGTASWLGYTLFPGRVWGGDNFNPYTNTINLYSDIPSVALHEAGHAKDYATRRYKGAYAASYSLPLVPLWHEAQATGDALTYVKEHGSADEVREAYRILYPAYGTYLGSAAGQLLALPGANIIPYSIGVVGGHIVGRVRGEQEAHDLEFEESHDASLSEDSFEPQDMSVVPTPIDDPS